MGCGLRRLQSAAGRPSMRGAREAATALSGRREAKGGQCGCSLPVRAPNSLTRFLFPDYGLLYRHGPTCHSL